MNENENDDKWQCGGHVGPVIPAGLVFIPSGTSQSPRYIVLKSLCTTKHKPNLLIRLSSELKTQTRKTGTRFVVRFVTTREQLAGLD
jgi:hypothetical protein